MPPAGKRAAKDVGKTKAGRKKFGIMQLFSPARCVIDERRGSMSGKFEEIMLIRGEDDLQAFRQQYGITGDIEKIY